MNLVKSQPKLYCLHQRGRLLHFQPLAFAYIRQALALGDPSVKIEDVIPKIFPSGPLFPTEKRITELFETNTYSVVNIFDATLRPQLNVIGVVEILQNFLTSGVVWDESGHIVTNYHVVGNALSKNPKLGEVVARVNILAAEGKVLKENWLVQTVLKILLFLSGGGGGVERRGKVARRGAAGRGGGERMQERVMRSRQSKFTRRKIRPKRLIRPQPSRPATRHRAIFGKLTPPSRAPLAL